MPGKLNVCHTQWHIEVLRGMQLKGQKAEYI